MARAIAGVLGLSPLEPRHAIPNSAAEMKPYPWIIGLVVALSTVLPGRSVLAAPVRVFAAASLQDPLEEIAQDWGGEVVASYAGSATIARQISLGAPADLVILANTAWMDWLRDKGHVEGPAQDILSNRLVLIGPAGSTPLPAPTAATLLDRLDGGRLAMGQHSAVPSGIYAQAWLENIGAWNSLRTRLAETDNVRAALVLVARGEMPLGVVYASDAAGSNRVSVLWTVPETQHPPIRYRAAALSPAGADFLTYLMTRTDTFVGAGFKALP